MTLSDWVTVEVPLEDWSETVENAAKIFPEKNRPKPGMEYITGPALDLARTAYLERAAQSQGLEREEVERAPLELDFKKAKGIGYGVLPLLGALLKYRADNSLETRIILPSPNDSKMIDYLQTWRFGQFFEAITGRPFESILTPESVQYWNEWNIENSEYSISRAFKGQIEAVLADSAIYLTPLLHQETYELRGDETIDQLRFRAGEIAAQKVAEWTRGRIADLLTKRLDIEEGRSAVEIVCSIILNELLTNSVAHTERRDEQSIIYTYGQFTKYGAEGTSRDYFILSVWDNGGKDLLVPKTIHNAIQNNKAFSEAFGKVKEHSFVWKNGKRAYEDTPESIAHLQEKDQKKRTRNDLQDSVHRATLAGVCAAPDAPQCSADYALKQLQTDNLEAIYQNSAGLGLYRVKRAAVDLLSGFIQYAGSDNRTELSRARYGDEREFKESPSSHIRENDDVNSYMGSGFYRVDIQHGKRNVWPLAGNLWTLWLPVRKELSQGAQR